ncbi:MAG: 30S ribosomal protein S2 [Melioribacteraceae bacterium]|nr:30S ribosomal protein S2 [Melioribacteraceae bacterium]
MKKIELTELIEAGAHFGHLTRRWNPKMRKFIFMEKNGIHIIDLKKTQKEIDKASTALYNIVSKGNKVLFVGTKKQAKSVVSNEANQCEMNWVTERWLGGMLTNFSTIRKSIKRLQTIDKMESDGTFEKITKKERLFLTREKDKLRRILDGVESMGRLPGALFIVDIKKESIAVKEAQRLNIPTFAIVDTNCDPNEVDYAIPANDDAVKTIELITKVMAEAITEGNVKAKELRAHETAEKERQRKEKADRPDDNKVKVRRFRSDGKKTDNKRRFKKDDAPRAVEAPKTVETPKTESAPAAVKEVKVENKESENKE